MNDVLFDFEPRAQVSDDLTTWKTMALQIERNALRRDAIREVGDAQQLAKVLAELKRRGIE